HLSACLPERERSQSGGTHRQRQACLPSASPRGEPTGRHIHSSRLGQWSRSNSINLSIIYA
ncbi:MAG: hypothetical protein V1933_08700, partial [Candidatus Omnitrophota bacterium]